MADLCVIKLCIKKQTKNQKNNIKNNERKNTTKFVICTTEAISSVRLLEEPILLLGEVWLCRKQVHINLYPNRA